MGSGPGVREVLVPVALVLHPFVAPLVFGCRRWRCGLGGGVAWMGAWRGVGVVVACMRRGVDGVWHGSWCCMDVGVMIDGGVEWGCGLVVWFGWSRLYLVGRSGGGVGVVWLNIA